MCFTDLDIDRLFVYFLQAQRGPLLQCKYKFLDRALAKFGDLEHCLADDRLL